MADIQSFSTHKNLTISSSRKDYSVVFKDSIDEVFDEFRDNSYWFIIDEKIDELYNSSFSKAVNQNQLITIKAEEPSKSYEGLIPIIELLIEKGFKKNNKLVAVGGGITQDVTSFIASILYRGVDWIFVPTNLLSQGDSCIGSKTSINFKGYKNQIGGFYPPTIIYSCQKFLDTLEPSEIYSGLGEMAHYYLIDGRESFEFFRNSLDDALKSNEYLSPVILRSLDIKKKMIEVDEFDEGPRNIFNYGHSFGHAIEGYTNYAIPHGIAVSFGMDIANAVSVEYGFMDEKERLEIRELLSKIWEKTSFPTMNIDNYLSILSKDKKNVAGDLRLILSKGLGSMFIHQMKKEDRLQRVIQNCLTDYHRNI